MGKKNVNVSDDIKLKNVKDDGVDLPDSDSQSQASSRSGGSHKDQAKQDDNRSTGSRKSSSKSIPREDTPFIALLKKILGMNDEERDDWEPVNAFNSEGIRDFFIGMKRIILGNRVNIFLVFIPFAFIAQYAWGRITVFILSMLGIIPLAKLLGSATEELALRTNQTIGGLLNATFGNAVEMIISVIALSKNLPRIVQASLLGSILSNLLLVLGMAMLFGGVKYKEQSFNSTASQTTSSMLLLSVASLVLPAAFLLSGDATVNDNNEPHGLLPLSHATAVVLLFIYGAYLTFQLKTHKHLYEEDEEEEAEKKTLSLWGALVLLTAVTVLVAFLAEYMVGSIEDVAKRYNISETFIAIILLPIVGNAAEHVTAVTVATKDKMDLSIGVAVGSSVQIALLVVPALVILGWIIDVHMTLYFKTFETVALFITVLVVNSVVADGHSNWLEGALLMAIYVILAVGFWFHQ